jgi:methylenetetrahydrofolate dehydrogenase (NADP+)/methenyltetrahydrofolate cyclohydrolase
MNKKIFDGRAEALIIKEEINSYLKKKNISPTLGIIQVGDDRFSNIFIREKIKFAQDLGINIVYQKLDKGYNNLVAEIEKFNKDANIKAFLVQLPIVGLEDTVVLDNISPDKDIDCLTKTNYTKLLSGEYIFSPGVYSAFLYIFKKCKLPKSSHILVIGSGFVGLPISNYLIQNKYNVTVLDKYAEKGDIINFSKLSDMVIFTAGVSSVIKKNDIKEGSFLINIGQSANFDGSISGGIDEDCIEKSSLFVPSKGGIGPLTVAMLFRNLCNIF